VKHAREDYNDRIQDSSGLIPSDEPVWLIRGQDKIAADAVRSYANLHRLNGGSDQVYEAAMKQADLMEAWEPKKSADIPKGVKCPV
jgi:hypothetical protein